MEDSGLATYVWILLTALIWGCTNPFLRRGAKGIDEIDKEQNRERSLSKTEGTSSSIVTTVQKAWNELKWCLHNWRLTVPFAVNQSGSVLFYYSLSQLDLSLVVPITNSLTTVITAVSGRVLGDEKESHNAWSYLGMTLVCLGSALCIYGKVD